MRTHHGDELFAQILEVALLAEIAFCHLHHAIMHFLVLLVELFALRRSMTGNRWADEISGMPAMQRNKAREKATLQQVTRGRH